MGLCSWEQFNLGGVFLNQDGLSFTHPCEYIFSSKHLLS